MSEEEIKQLMKKEMLKTIKNDLHSEMIFVYVDNLEKENKQLKSILTELEEWLKYQFEHTLQQNNYHSVLDEIQELKEKYK